MPPLALTGERELDRIVAAFNRLNDRLKTSREESARMGRDLARAVENLLLNALQHSPPGGQITLGAEVSADRCRLLVSDTGPGVAPTDAERIFEPFVTTRAEGVGLGLSLVREIAEAYGGSARCLPPAPGQPGAVFMIEIPAHGQNPDRR